MSPLAGVPRIPILLIIGAVRPPHTIVVNITIERVVETYISLCSPGIFSDCKYFILLYYIGNEVNIDYNNLFDIGNNIKLEQKIKKFPHIN